MAFERLVGIEVTDEAGYQRYRDAMTPLLEARGGGFGYDFRIAEVLRAETDQPINRVFTIRFPSAAEAEAFFNDPEYLTIRQRDFEPSVGATTLIASYEPET